MKSVNYKEEQKGVCPFCGDWDVVGGSVVIEEGAAYQKCTCRACDKKWEDRYKLTSYLEEES